MTRLISLNHGSGGRQTHELIRDLFVKKFGMPEPLTDSAILKKPGSTLVFTTDAYVVDPVFFPGGNIGKLSVCGTVNDLAVSGAKPEYIACSFIIEEGFPFSDLVIITDSMAEAAVKAGVKIVAGDTKVVGKGKCDRIFITTSGTGTLDGERNHISTGGRVKAGDKLIINGSLGNHSIAVLGARNNLSFSAPVVSDCAPLNNMIAGVLNKCSGVHFMRDLTRGGLAGVLNELAEMTGTGISINEPDVPVDEPVRGVCEMLGFDPLYLANEGKVLIVAEAGSEKEILGILKHDPLGKESSVIGEITEEYEKMVVLKTAAGGSRILDMPSGVQLPRIC
ncbi:MAG: hydrogenase expression/formation protein HypE [Bacteroidetes bacterium RBG_13_43_22]|nr:MAG: hydrogenase expression/formation protein HypE [Bacteroidetes bacterium RBG_13_43_22]